ncbi:MAG: MFS transporter [Pseudonocardiales bacterium]|nr:MAG: MFS transporter [Pseudonocardiales bacterium]
MAVSAALPTAARDLHGLGSYGWAFTGFLIANVVGMVVSGQFSDAHGPRGPLIAGMVSFLGGLLLAGTAVTMEQLVAGRVVQGFGSGLLITATYVVIGETYPEDLRPKLFAGISSAWVLPALIGPVISGTITQHLSWRWVFLGLVPFVLLGAVLMVPVMRTLHVEPGSRSSKLADPRRILHAFAVAGGIAALAQAGQHPSSVSIALAVLGLVALVWGLRTLLPAGTIRVRRGVSAPIALRGLLAGSFFAVESLVPLSLTVQHGYSATAAGLPLACSGLTWAAGSWWQGRTGHTDEQGHRVRLVRAGFAFVAVSAVAVAVTAQPHVPGWLIYPAWSLAGIGAGLAMTSSSVLLLKYTTDVDRGSDSAALQLSDATVSALTTGVAGVLVAAAARGTLGYTAAFTILDVTMAGVAFVGVLVAGQVRAPT